MTDPRSESKVFDRPAKSILEIRRAFPALERRHRGYPVAYFDGPGGTQVPRQVVDAMADYLFNHNANTHWAYPTSQETDLIIDEGRRAVADLLNADRDEIIFGPNMTTLTFQLTRALAWSRFEPGDEILMTELDHHANVDPWKAMAQDWQCSIRTVKMIPETGQLDWDDLEHQINPRTKLLAIGAASNALGTINEIPRAVAMARAFGALTFVDAVHYVPHRLVDVRAWDCDFLACSAYKFHGPHVGILYGKKGVLARLDSPKLEPAPNHPPDRFETGTQNHEGIAGVAAAIDFLADLAKLDVEMNGETTSTTRRRRLETAFGALHREGSRLLTLLWDGLSKIPGVTLYGPTPDAPRTPTLSFTMRGKSTAEISRFLADRGIFASNGNFYAMTVTRRLGVEADGLVRLGCACYTTEEEVGRVVEAVHESA